MSNERLRHLPPPPWGPPYEDDDPRTEDRQDQPDGPDPETTEPDKED